MEERAKKVAIGKKFISIIGTPSKEAMEEVIDSLEKMDKRNMELPEEERVIRIIMNYKKDLNDTFLWRFTKDLRKASSLVETYCNMSISTSQLPIFLSGKKRFAFRNSEFELRKDTLSKCPAVKQFICKACPKLHLDTEFFGKSVSRTLDANEAWRYEIITEEPLGSCISCCAMFSDLDRAKTKEEQNEIWEKYLV